MNTPPDKMAERWEQTHDAAMTVIDAERQARVQKTEKLRALRLARTKAQAPSKSRARRKPSHS